MVSLVLTASELASLERTADAKNKANLDIAKLNADVTKSNASVDSKISALRNNVARNQRMAGRLALAAELGAEAFRPQIEAKAPTPIDYSKARAAIEGTFDPSLYDKQRAIIQQDIDFIKNLMNDQNGQSVYKSGAEKLSMNPSSPLTSDPNRYALSQVVKYAEGTLGNDSYRVLYGHTANNPRLLNDFADHPNQPLATPWGTQSEAAGAYQFMLPTWRDIQAANPDIKDFSPQSQEKAADWLFKRRDVNPYAPIGSYDEFVDVMTKLAPEWASLPYKGGGSRYGQPSKTPQELYQVYQQSLKGFQPAS